MASLSDSFDPFVNVHILIAADVMVGYFTGRPAWMDEGFYPVEEHLLKGFDANDKDAVLFVDIAGGVGHYTEQFRSRFPNTSGRLVLQDLPGVIQSSGDLHPRIEKIEYDFLTEQPVKGIIETHSR